jgi:hypothetical protein
VHNLADVIRTRIFAIACGYEGSIICANDPAFKLACGAGHGSGLYSQPTLSRLENAPRRAPSTIGQNVSNACGHTIVLATAVSSLWQTGRGAGCRGAQSAA